VQLDAPGPLVQRLKVFQPMFKPIAAEIDAPPKGVIHALGSALRTAK
jgi:hypothetical protein